MNDCNCGKNKPKKFKTLGEIWDDIPKYKKGEPMIPINCMWCNKTNCIEVTPNGDSYGCRYCGFGGTTSYALKDSEDY
jgi:hypothetical protein